MAEVGLVTLTGPGGAGKTRLSLQVQPNRSTSSRMASGSSISRRSATRLLLPTLAQALGIRKWGTISYRTHSKAPCERRTAAGARQLRADSGRRSARGRATGRSRPGESARDEPGSPPNLGRARVLGSATGIAGPEQRPSWESLSQYAAVALFIQRAQAVKPDFQVTNETAPAVADICVRLEGLPLAIELAAAWTRVLSCQAIGREIEQSLDFLMSSRRDVPARHRNLRAVLDHSWKLLVPEEQRVLRCLAPFRGGFTRQAAEAVAGASLSDLAGLIDKSLMRTTHGERYDLHELVRQYAEGQLLAAAEEGHARDVHLSYYLRLAGHADRELPGAAQAELLAQLTVELDNLRAALRWCESSPDRLLQGLRLSGLLGWFWFLANLWREGHQWTELFLARAAHAEASPDRARALVSAGGLALTLDDYTTAEAHLAEGETFFRQAGEHFYTARALSFSGTVALYQGALDLAHARFTESLHLYDPVADLAESLYSLEFLGETLLAMGDVEQAYQVLQMSLARARPLGYCLSLPQNLIDLARCERYLGDLGHAETHLQECLALTEQLGILRFRSQALCHLGWIALQRKTPSRAHELFTQSLQLFHELADMMGVTEALEGLAGSAGAARQWTWAAATLGTAATLRERIGVPIPIENRSFHAALEADLRQAVSPTELAAAYVRGQDMAVEQAIAKVLEAVPQPEVAVTTPDPAAILPNRMPMTVYPAGLSEREVEILRHLARGLTYAEIGQALIISSHTVNAHLRTIYGKLGVTSRSAATRFAVEHHLV